MENALVKIAHPRLRRGVLRRGAAARAAAVDLVDHVRAAASADDDLHTVRDGGCRELGGERLARAGGTERSGGSRRLGGVHLRKACQVSVRRV